MVHRKGDIQKNKDGIKYQTDIFKAKDRRFIESSWVHEKNRIVESVMKSYGYNLEYRDQENPYLSQKNSIKVLVKIILKRQGHGTQKLNDTMRE